MNINFPEFFFIYLYSMHKRFSQFFFFDIKTKSKFSFKNILSNDWFPDILSKHHASDAMWCMEYALSVSGHDPELLSMYKWLDISNSKLTKSGELNSTHFKTLYCILAYMEYVFIIQWMNATTRYVYCICEWYTKSNV